MLRIRFGFQRQLLLAKGWIAGRRSPGRTEFSRRVLGAHNVHERCQAGIGFRWILRGHEQLDNPQDNLVKLFDPRVCAGQKCLFAYI